MLDKTLTSNNVILACIDYLEDRAKNDSILKTKLETNSQTTKDLEWYIMKQARDTLNNQNGGIEKEVVFGWAVHFVDENITEPARASKAKGGVSDSLTIDSDDVEDLQKSAKPKPKAKAKLFEQDLFDFLS